MDRFPLHPTVSNAHGDGFELHFVHATGYLKFLLGIARYWTVGNDVVAPLRAAGL